MKTKVKQTQGCEHYSSGESNNIWHTLGPLFKFDSLDCSGIINSIMYTKNIRNFYKYYWNLSVHLWGGYCFADWTSNT